MKTIIVLVIFLALAGASFAQEVVPQSALTKDEYRKKAKTQKTWGWIVTGVGTVGLTAVAIADMRNVTEGILTTVFTLGYVQPEPKSFGMAYAISGVVVATGNWLVDCLEKKWKTGKDGYRVFRCGHCSNYSPLCGD